MTITQAFLTSEISSLWPDNTTGAITPANARTTLNDIVTAIFQGIAPTGLSTPNTWTALQTFSSGVTVDGITISGSVSGIPSTVSNSDSTLTISPIIGNVVASLNLGHANTWTATQTFNATTTFNFIPTINTSIIFNQGGILGTYTNPIAFTTIGTNSYFNSLTISGDNLAAATPFVDGWFFFHSYGGSATTGGSQSLEVFSRLASPTSVSNPTVDRFYVAGIFTAQAASGDACGSGTEQGSMFALNPVATLGAAATHMVECSGIETDIACNSASSVLYKFGNKIVQSATDAAAGSVLDSALFFGNQSGAQGWNNLIQIGASVVYTAPLKSTGAIMITQGSQTIGTGIDISSATITGNAFKSPGFILDGKGGLSVTKSFTSGSGGLVIRATQTQPNSSDTTDTALELDYTLSANSATNELDVRGFSSNFTNSLTGGGAITSARLMDLATFTSASTTTTNLECIFIEAGTSAGTVTTGYGLHISSIQGTTKWGIADDSGSNWYNATGGLSLGTSTGATATFLKLAAGTTAKSQINFAASTAPSSPVDGDWWFDGTNLNIRISGSTKTITHS